MVWKHASSDTPKKFKVTPSAVKVRATVFGTVNVWWWQIICQEALQLQAHIMLLNYINYMKHWKANVEESCDVEFFCCMIMRLPTPLLLWRLLRLNVATISTSSTIFARSSTLRLLFVPTAERTLEWHTFFKWPWRHCVCGGLSSGARWTLLQDWYTKAAETMEQVHWSWRRLCGKINQSLLLCCVSLYMGPETLTTLVTVCRQELTHPGSPRQRAIKRLFLLKR